MPMPTSLRNGSYRRWLSEDLSTLIESKELGFSTVNKTYLRSRWLVQILQLEQDATRARKLHQALRLTTVIGSLLLLMFVTLRFNDTLLGGWAGLVYYLTVMMSLAVAASIAVEHIFNYGERARLLAIQLDKLKTEGWCFLQLSGRYNRFGTHEEAFASFANQVESLSRRDAGEVYVPEIVRDRRVESEASANVPEKKPHSFSPTATPERSSVIRTSPTTTTTDRAQTMTHHHVEPESIQ
ncbi:MAG: DUF4231 domain-containing protein [Pyrinomonadaceae bacterium MAG19_C2-C3]|nr:DUF4231 domain-containing protein [Pyrinomonadaceae bacterium MAG19_C2-C3]